MWVSALFSNTAIHSLAHIPHHNLFCNFIILTSDNIAVFFVQLAQKFKCPQRKLHMDDTTMPLKCPSFKR
jgi:hypothetical protein